MKRYLSLLAFLLLMSSSLLSAQEVEKQVKFETNKGSFTVKLYNETPLHRDNFLKLVEAGAYNNLTFHRVIANFMIQAGGVIKGNNTKAYEALEEKYSELIPAEIQYPKLFHKKGALAAARTSNEVNPEKKSDPIQFFIVVGQCYLENEMGDFKLPEGVSMTEEIKHAYMTEGGTPHLDCEYTVFGELVDGWKTIYKIQKVETDTSDKPLKDVYIKSAKILN